MRPATQATTDPVGVGTARRGAPVTKRRFGTALLAALLVTAITLPAMPRAEAAPLGFVTGISGNGTADTDVPGSNVMVSIQECDGADCDSWSEVTAPLTSGGASVSLTCFLVVCFGKVAFDFDLASGLWDPLSGLGVSGLLFIGTASSYQPGQPITVRGTNLSLGQSPAIVATLHPNGDYHMRAAGWSAKGCWYDVLIGYWTENCSVGQTRYRAPLEVTGHIDSGFSIRGF